MKTRVISATVLIILVVACFALGPVTRALFLLAAMIMAVWETCRAIGYKNVVCQPWILYAYCVATVAELWFNADALAFEITFFLAVFAAMTAGIVSKKIRGAGALATLGVLACLRLHAYPPGCATALRFSAAKDSASTSSRPR